MAWLHGASNVLTRNVSASRPVRAALAAGTGVGVFCLVFLASQIFRLVVTSPLVSVVLAGAGALTAAHVLWHGSSSGVSAAILGALVLGSIAALAGFLVDPLLPLIAGPAGLVLGAVGGAAAWGRRHRDAPGVALPPRPARGPDPDPSSRA